MRTFYEEWSELDAEMEESNSSIQTGEFEIDAQTTDKPMGVATYKTATDMPEHIRKALPNQDDLLYLMENMQVEAEENLSTAV